MKRSDHITIPLILNQTSDPNLWSIYKIGTNDQITVDGNEYFSNKLKNFHLLTLGTRQWGGKLFHLQTPAYCREVSLNTSSPPRANTLPHAVSSTPMPYALL